jgi:hypothetical protein
MNFGCKLIAAFPTSTEDEYLVPAPPKPNPKPSHIRGAQTGVFELDIRIFNPPYIHSCKSLAAETGLKSRNVEKRINAV